MKGAKALPRFQCIASDFGVAVHRPALGARNLLEISMRMYIVRFEGKIFGIRSLLRALLACAVWPDNLG
ncbi:MAG: hypothetical protein AUH88_04275 [Acidobacteria bacterium 13_1_40CM_4_61_5]|nr:MAG: hypothetical protein AUH88_04275 [Acidobacteria bacterium 13_1_40CM_4_61_5]